MRKDRAMVVVVRAMVILRVMGRCGIGIRAIPIAARITIAWGIAIARMA
jgi:hypothetical protein